MASLHTASILPTACILAIKKTCWPCMSIIAPITPNEATGTRFEWNANDFNPDYGGLNHACALHVTGPIYQTLPFTTV